MDAESGKMNKTPASSAYEITMDEGYEFKNLLAWDSSEECLKRDLIGSKRSNAYASALLVKTHKEYAVNRIKRIKEIDTIKNEQLAFAKSFIEFDPAIISNSDKKLRNLEKLITEKNIQTHLDKEIRKADTQIEILREIEYNMKQHIEDRKKYVNFLEALRTMAPTQFVSGVNEIPDRFELLLKVREELAGKRIKSVEKMQELSNNIFRITNEHSQYLINLQTQVSKLNDRYEKAKRENIHLESLVNTVQQIAQNKSKQLEMSKLACWNLYLLICKNNNLRVTSKKHEILKQLKVIEKTILVLKRATIDKRTARRK